MPLIIDRQTEEKLENYITYTSNVSFSDDYAILIDKNDTLGFPHSFTNSIDISQLSISIKFLSNTAESKIKIGVIKNINSSNSDIDWIITKHFASGNSKDSINIYENYGPNIKFDESSNSHLTNDKDIENFNISNISLLNSPNGIITPEIGDVILKAEYFMDNYDYNINLSYHTH